MTTISSVVLSMRSSPSKVKTAERRREFRGTLNIKRAAIGLGVSALPTLQSQNGLSVQYRPPEGRNGEQHGCCASATTWGKEVVTDTGRSTP